MPGSSVSACHLCHMHSHNHDNLVRTSPLRHSRSKSKALKYSASSGGHRHHHGYSNGGYSSRDDMGDRMGRANSASALARLTEQSHSLPGSRSNSLSRYHGGVSTLPDGGDPYSGRGMRPGVSTRSLDLNPPLTTLLDPRTTSLPRVSTSMHPQIHAQPDILVNAMPRSRANSRSGSLNRNPVTLSQDNSHDYYLDMHRQRFKEEKRKHKFNLQTVMLIGCYSLLVMIAIVVGVVLCYQNGWLGLGPPQEKISGDKTTINKSNSIGREAHDSKNRRIPPDKANNPEFNNPSLNNNKYLHSAGLLPTKVHHQNPQASEDDVVIQSNNPRHITTKKTNQNRLQPRPAVENDNNRNLPNERQSDNHGQFNPPFEANNNQRNDNNHRTNQNIEHDNRFHGSVNNPTRTLIPQNPTINHGNFPHQQPQDPRLRQNPVGFNENLNTQGTHRPINPAVSHNPSINRQNPSNLNNQHIHKQILHPKQPGITNQNLNPNLHRVIPSHPNPALTLNNNFNNAVHPTLSNNQPSLQHPQRNTPPLKQGSLEANTIAKTLLQANSPTSQVLRHNPNLRTQNDGPNLSVKEKDKIADSETSADSLASSIADKILEGDTSSLTTQELLDLLAIRRMRDLLNSQGNTQTILHLLRNVQPSENTRLEIVKEEKLIPSDLTSRFDELENSRGSGRKIGGSISADPNDFQILELLHALQGQNPNTRPQENKKSKIPAPNDEKDLKNLINKTINGAIIRLISSRVDELKRGKIDPNLAFNVSGISVFPVNSEDLKILLKSNPGAVRDKIGNFSEERLKSLQILQRLIELSSQKQNVPRHVEFQTPPSQNTGETKNHPVSRSNVPIPAARISDPPAQNVQNSVQKTLEEPPKNNVQITDLPIRNVTSIFNRGETALKSSEVALLSTNANPHSHLIRSPPPEPDPTFAVMVRSDGVGQSNRANKPVFPPAFISKKPTSRGRLRHVPAGVPIKEIVDVRPGRRRSRSDSTVVRAWTHMDSRGTVSKGRVHRDGSFAFTNCRPASICANKGNQKNNEASKKENN